MYTIEHWDRFFALYEGETLIAVTVYKKGAKAVQARLEYLEAQLAAKTATKTPKPDLTITS
jgi:hypothetical protein